MEGGFARSPARAPIQSAQSFHHVSRCSVAPASHRSASGGRSSFVHRRTFGPGGLTMPAMCPEDVSTKRTGPLSSCVLRYETRHGFQMDAHTVGLARACVEMELVGELSSARLRDELQALLSEEQIADSLHRMAELGLDRAVQPHLTADEDSVALTGELDRLRDRFAPETPAWRLRLAALARRLPPDELYDWFERLKLRRRDADRIADAVTVAPKLRELAASTDEPAALRALAEPHDPDGVLVALAGAAEPARSRLERAMPTRWVPKKKTRGPSRSRTPRAGMRPRSIRCGRSTEP